MKLQNSIETACSVSAIQHTPDLLFFSIRGVGKRREERRLIHVLSIPSAFSGVLVRTTGGDGIKITMRYRMKTHSRGQVVWIENASLWGIILL